MTYSIRKVSFYAATFVVCLFAAGCSSATERPARAAAEFCAVTQASAAPMTAEFELQREAICALRAPVLTAQAR